MTVSVDPNFKSSLPPRKRAKTEEEKEQRRVERILRNRRAAHASRERRGNMWNTWRPMCWLWKTTWPPCLTTSPR
ncbi:CIC11C00000000665 [Sungouiella intermedia]|uniref:CIC11C00000000665 n=1 Tax=Sungouiella intermedia TaxID=45354 RepID=A0A1L0BY53_9ASCO|nr:CIC11C00000000665 [[Candida] intermedia]